MTERHEHDLGLRYDLRLLSRRRAVQVMGAIGAVALAGCSDDDATSTAVATSSTSRSTSGSTSGSATTPTDGTAKCTTIPEETAGPYPGDGTNGPDALGTDGIVRRDITSSFGEATGQAEGVPTTLTLTILDSSAGCGPLAGAAVYVWHCDREGRYSRSPCRSRCATRSTPAPGTGRACETSVRSH